MLGRSLLSSNTSAGDRVFIYEVAGLHQNDRTENSNHSIRNSGTTLMQVPFNRMSEFMQQINRLGGRIVAIHTPNQSATQTIEE